MRIINKLFTLLISYKLTIFLIIFLAYNLLPFNSRVYLTNFSYPKNEKVSFATALKTWDGQHYLFLSQEWYTEKNISNSFFPLFPSTIYIVDKLINSPIVSGLLMANIFSILSIWYFFLFSKLVLKDEEASMKSLLLLISFPTAFFSSLIYSESLMLFLIIAFFYYLYSKKYFVASMLALLMPLTRAVGVLILLPYFTHWLIEVIKAFSKEYLIFIKNILLSKKTYYLLSPLVGILIYLLIMQIYTGNYWSGIDAQKSFISHRQLNRIFDPFYFFVNFLYPGSLSLHGFTNSIIDRIFFVFYCAMMFLVYKKLDKVLFVYSLVFGSLPLFGSFMSYPRYVFMVFPIFIALGSILTKKKYKELFYPVLFFMIMLQVLFLIMHTLNYWVA